MELHVTGWTEAITDKLAAVNKLNEIPRTLASRTTEDFNNAATNMVESFYSTYSPRVYKRTRKFAKVVKPYRTGGRGIVGGVTASGSFVQDHYYDDTNKKAAHEVRITGEDLYNQIWLQGIRYFHPKIHENIPYSAIMYTGFSYLTGPNMHAVMTTYQQQYINRLKGGTEVTDMITSIFDSSGGGWMMNPTFTRSRSHGWQRRGWRK